MYRNYAVTIARTGDCIIFLRDQAKKCGIVVSRKCEVGCLDATGLIATGSVRKSTSGGYPVADYIQRDAA